MECNSAGQTNPAICLFASAESETTAQTSLSAEAASQEEPSSVCHQCKNHKAEGSYYLQDQPAYFKGNYYLGDMNCSHCQEPITANLGNPMSPRKRYKAYHCVGMNSVHTGGTTKTDYQCNHCLHPECYFEMVGAGEITRESK